MKAKLDARDAHEEARLLERVASILRSAYQAEFTALENPALSSDAREELLAGFLQVRNMKNGAEQCHRLVQYLYMRGWLAAQSMLVFHFYLAVKETHDRGADFRSALIFTRAVLTSATAGLLTALAPDAQQLLAKLLTAGGSGVATLLIEFIRVYLLKDVPSLSFAAFKKNFLAFVGSRARELEHRFQEMYPLRDFEAWAGVENLSDL